MKIPSLLRTPKYQRFHLEPRYYDPVKEELQEREARIRQSMLADKIRNEENTIRENSSLHGSFTRQRSSRKGSATYTQIVIMLLLSALIFGYIYLGDVALYTVVGISSVLLYLKMKRIL
jgi:type VI protein secretion system component VasF